jgi:uncharacterized membrane protein
MYKPMGGNMNQELDNFSKKHRMWLFSMHFGKACGCHQKPERSPFFKDHQFFLCFRCSGIFISEIILAPLFYLLNLHFGFYTLLFAIPLIIDGSIQHFFHIESTNTRRLITGCLGGYGIGIFVIHMIITIIKYII